ncbi:MAG: purine-binding chemotaxis protein CheW [Desulfovibrionaceae bacterium]|jgi:purine-binding chemotaxis protein CheW|nr:purine-binding chemotaxis protein CheW [Desulfovibrionaceae bacterium]
MMKSPEEYFSEQDFSVQPNTDGTFTGAERSFIQKYLGVEDQQALQKLGLDVPGDVLEPTTAGEAPAPAPEEAEPPLEDLLKTEPELQLVSFVLDGREFTVPISVVQEVIRFLPPTKLPAAPRFIAGIVNLRGRVTPLVRLRDLLGISAEGDGRDQFIVVCKRKGLQVGLMISEVSTMYRVSQETVEWGIESHLGVNVQFVSGLMKAGDKLVGILSVDRIVEKVLKS